MYFCSISSGSSGNCIYVGSEKTKLLIDVGVSKKKVINSLNLMKVCPGSINGILVTHEHLDHYRGVGVLSRSYNIPIYLNKATYEAISDKIGNIKNVNLLEECEFVVGDLEIKMFRLPHDAVDPVGYTIMNNNKKISIATDMGYVSKEVFENLKDSNVILIESNYNEHMVKMGAYPYFLKERILGKFGHLSNEDCGNIVVELVKNFPKKIVLGHLSNVNNFPELAYKTVEEIIYTNGLKIGIDLDLTIAHRDLPSNYMRI